MFQETAEFALSEYFRDRKPETMFVEVSDGDIQLPTLDSDIKCAQNKCNLLSAERIRKARVGWREFHGVQVNSNLYDIKKNTKGFRL